MSRSSLCDYSKACILAEETVTTVNIATATAAANNFNKKVKFKNGGLFIKWLGSIINMQIDDAHDIDVVMPM